MRSFSKIAAPDPRQKVDPESVDRPYWPEPLIQVNPVISAALSFCSSSVTVICTPHVLSYSGSKSPRVFPSICI